MHLMGATYGQISRLFGLRSAFDGLLGGLMALAAAFLVLAALQARVIATGSGLLGSVGMPAHVWPALAALPVLAALLAAVTARLTVFRSLGARLCEARWSALSAPQSQSWCWVLRYGWCCWRNRAMPASGPAD